MTRRTVQFRSIPSRHLGQIYKNLSVRSLIEDEIRGQTLFFDPSVTRD
jgi:hypothetical protein